MFGVERNMWRYSSPNPVVKPVHLKQIVHDFIRVGFEYLQRRRFHNLFGPSVVVLCYPENKDNFPPIQMELSVFHFLPVPLILWQVTTKESLTPSSQHPEDIFMHLFVCSCLVKVCSQLQKFLSRAIVRKLTFPCIIFG